MADADGKGLNLTEFVDLSAVEYQSDCNRAATRKKSSSVGSQRHESSGPSRKRHSTSPGSRCQITHQVAMYPDRDKSGTSYSPPLNVFYPSSRTETKSLGTNQPCHEQSSAGSCSSTLPIASTDKKLSLPLSKYSHREETLGAAGDNGSENLINDQRETICQLKVQLEQAKNDKRRIDELQARIDQLERENRALLREKDALKVQLQRVVEDGLPLPDV